MPYRAMASVGVANLVLPTMFANLPGGSVDLALNTLSMAEMPESTVSFYCRELLRILSGNGVFYEQNMDNRHVKFGNFGHVSPVVAKFFNGLGKQTLKHLKADFC
jgi:hypothetical protein